MGSITSVDDLITRLTGGASGTPETVWWHKSGARINATTDATTMVAGRFRSMWRWDGSPASGVAPTSAAACDVTTDGSLLQANPSGGRQKWLVGGWHNGTGVGGVLVYDRLLHHGNAVGNTTSAQTVGGTITRNTGGVGNQIWVEVYSQLGVNSGTVSASYTNQAGTSGRTTNSTLFGGATVVGREGGSMCFLPLQRGDTGVQSVQTVTGPNTGAAGNYGVTIVRPLMWIPGSVFTVVPWLSYLDGHHIPEVETDACLAMAFMPVATNLPEMFGCLTMVEA